MDLNIFQLTGDSGLQSDIYNRYLRSRYGDSLYFRMLARNVEGLTKSPSKTTTPLTDITPKTDPQQSIKNWENTSRNIGKLGTQMLQIGAGIGNVGVYKAGVMTNAFGSALDRARNWQKTSGLEGDALKSARQNNTVTATGMAGDLAAGVDQAFFRDVLAKQSGLTQGLDLGYDTAANAISTIPGWGTVVGGAMKTAGLATDILRKNGIGTDLMTTKDKILGSKFLALTPMGLANSIWADSTQDFSVDQDMVNTLGGDYSYKNLYRAWDLSNKKFGLASGRLRRRADRIIDLAKKLQNDMIDIADNATDLRNMAKGTHQLNWLNYLQRMNGGVGDYKLSAKNGAKLEKVRQIINIFPEDNWKPTIEEFKEGGELPTQWVPTITIALDGAKLSTRKYKTYLNFTDYLKDTERWSDDYDYEGLYNDEDLYLKWEQEELETPGKAHFFDTYKLPNHMTFSTDSKYSNDKTLGGKWVGSDTTGWTFETSPYVESQHSLEEMLEYFKEREPNATLIYSGKSYSPVQFKKSGGEIKEATSLSDQQNVIPDGALHKNKHHMENTEGLTQKGIPVIDNDGALQAEIELNEIIFSLEVTKKLEELYNKYNDTSGKELDEAAIEAGKLLVQEILYNTKDNTGLLKTITDG